MEVALAKSIACRSILNTQGWSLKAPHFSSTQEALQRHEWFISSTPFGQEVKTNGSRSPQRAQGSTAVLDEQDWEHHTKPTKLCVSAATGARFPPLGHCSPPTIYTEREIFLTHTALPTPLFTNSPSHNSALWEQTPLTLSPCRKDTSSGCFKDWLKCFLCTYLNRVNNL